MKAYNFFNLTTQQIFNFPIICVLSWQILEKKILIHSSCNLVKKKKNSLTNNSILDKIFVKKI